MNDATMIDVDEQNHANSDHVDVSMFSMESDQMACIELRDVIKECDLLTDVALSITNIIAQFSLGKMITCDDCQKNEILLLPSMETNFKRYKCNDCYNGYCSNIQCESCIKQSNAESIYVRKVDEPNRMRTCCKCTTYHRDCNPRCLNCLFICKGCYEYFCKKMHRECICNKCGAEFCSKAEAEFVICAGCNETVCNACNSILYKFNGITQWIPCGEFFNVCNSCLNLSILDQYGTDEDVPCYKSCHESLKHLERHESLQMFPTNVLVLLVLYSHDCELNDCKSLI